MSTLPEDALEEEQKVAHDEDKPSQRAPAPKPDERFGARHMFVFMSFLGFINMYAMRVNLSVAIVGMVNSTSSDDDIGDQCEIPSDFFDDDGSSGDFDWDSEEQGIILGAFYYGYLVTQIPGGYLAEKYGGKWVFGLGLLVTSVFTLLTPVCAEAGKGVLIGARIMEGLGEGVALPAMQAMISKWTPTHERAALASWILSGTQAGSVLSLPVSGVLADQVSWQSVFYVFGSLGVAWFVAWVFLVYDMPATHPRISREEREYIETNIISANEGKKLPVPPWKNIMTSVPFISLILVHFGQNYGFYTLLSETPTYLNNIQHYDLTTNGFLSALPYLTGWILCLIFGYISDYLIKSDKISIGTSRKLFNSIAHYGPALALIWLGWVGCDRTQAIIALCLAVGLNGACYSGYQINHVDLSPNYSGTLMGITNMIANINGILAPYIVGVIINDNQTIEAWRAVYLIAAGVYVFFNTLFVIFGSGELQWWNTYWEKDNKKEEEGKMK